jgi:alpha/beta superfamily hydrolase
MSDAPTGQPPIVEEEVRFPCGPLDLEGVLAYPEEGEPHAALVLLAPHPHMGGRMDNNVVRHLARRSAGAGCVTLRFNYRGVGASTIELAPGTSLHDHFAGLERERRYEELLPDCVAAWRTLHEASPRVPRRAIVGYSLGAILAGRLAAEVDATHLVAISPPVARVSLAWLRGCTLPKLFVGGDSDFAFDLTRFAEEYALLSEPKRFVRLPGSDHFYRKEEERVYELLAEFLFPAVDTSPAAGASPSAQRIG